jgi:hypothetical protein
MPIKRFITTKEGIRVEYTVGGPVPGSIQFPEWVTMTPCENRTHSRFDATPHGRVRRNTTISNDWPMWMEKENGGFPGEIPF